MENKKKTKYCLSCRPLCRSRRKKITTFKKIKKNYKKKLKKNNTRWVPELK